MESIRSGSIEIQNLDDLNKGVDILERLNKGFVTTGTSFVPSSPPVLESQDNPSPPEEEMSFTVGGKTVKISDKDKDIAAPIFEAEWTELSSDEGYRDL